MKVRVPAELRYLLVQPPLTDPTTPYHSISYLVGAARAAGFTNGVVIDANVEALNDAASEARVSELLASCASTRRDIERASSRTRLDELRYQAALAASRLSPDSVEKAIAILKDPRTFYDFNVYDRARRTILCWLKALSSVGLPFAFDGFALNVASFFNISRTADVGGAEILSSLIRPFEGYFSGSFSRRVRDGQFDVVGISVAYTSQLPFAAWMARRVRELLPEATVCVGGTEVSDVVKYSSTGSLFKVFDTCDAAVVGEGESAFVRILDCAANGRRIPIGQGIAVRSALSSARVEPHYEDLAALPSPAYEVWEWSKYWSPEPVVLYSPTRGCYWNRCTFCDYGMNSDGPTSPSRDRPLDLLRRDLSAIAQLGRVIYFAVDAISPRYLRQLAKVLLELGVDLKWSAELRLEKKMETDLALLMSSAGCVAVSLGYESAAQRVLDMIDKGVQIARVPGILKALSDNGIGVQLMGFTGFPGERDDEAAETYGFVGRHRDYWAIAGIGEYVLTSGSIVAKDPDRFGVQHVSRYEGDDIGRHLWWRDAVTPPRRVEGPERVPSPILDGCATKVPGGRPFVGGIDSTHSLLYFARHGKTLVPRAALASEESYTYSQGIPTRVLTTESDLTSFHQHHRVRRRSAGWKEISSWLGQSFPDDGSRIDLQIAEDGTLSAATEGTTYRLVVEETRRNPDISQANIPLDVPLEAPPSRL
jgi:hypothetical protein